VRAAFVAVQEEFKAQLGTDLSLLLVSTDPVRDTPARIANYTKTFDGRWRFLTGSRETLQPVWDDYHVTVLDPDSEQRINHTWMVALVDREGLLRFRYLGQDDPRETLIPDISMLLKESP
jgi:cytochrome oxidase Cu insertion factor (SCO1/SenC/PrrC family)